MGGLPRSDEDSVVGTPRRDARTAGPAALALGFNRTITPKDTWANEDTKP